MTEMTPRTTPRSPQRGFTLMEIVVSIVLLGILGVVGTTMISSSFYTTRVISAEHLAYSSARYALERMGREIREVQFNTETSALSISTMTASQLSFVKSFPAGTSSVSLQYNAGSLSLSYPPAASATLANEIIAFSFTYLDANLAVTNVPNDVRHVRMALTVRPSGAQALPLITQVSLRNL